MGRRGKSWLTDDPEEREWYGLARKYGCTVVELQGRMTDLEFRRHCQDQQDYPDPLERMAQLLYVNTILLNIGVGSLMKDGKPPFSIRQIAPWMAKHDVAEKPIEIQLNMVEHLFKNVGSDKVKLKPKETAK